MPNQGKTIPVRTEARRVVTASLRRAGLSKVYDTLVEQDPEIGDTACRLAWYLSLKVRHPHGRRPLFHQCLADAVVAAVEGRGGGGDAGSVDRFVEAATNHLPLLLRYRICRDEEVWDPLYGSPLMEWFRLGDYEIVRNSDDISGMVAIASYKSVLAGRLRGIDAAVNQLEGASA